MTTLPKKVCASLGRRISMICDCDPRIEDDDVGV